MDLGIAGKRALVLGASRGLGAAVANALAQEGVEVLAAARTPPPEEVCTEAGGSVRGISLDLSVGHAVDGLATALVAEGGVDILVNNSGGPAPGPASAQSAEAWEEAFRTMAGSLFRLSGLLLPAMIGRGWGRIITIGSSGVVQPIGGLALSNGVRGAVAGWSKTLATEVAPHGITVNVVLPGRIDTDRVRTLDQGRSEKTGQTVEAVKRQSLAEIPVGRYGSPDELAAAVAFLASTQASYITGSMIRVDGGLIRGL